jgi:environmental stress-induced protein Ves
VILLLPPEYRRQPWKNGLGESLEIAAERDGAGEWAGLVWSFSRTFFDQPLAFSDLAGMDRIITVVAGRGLTLRARDGGDDISVPALVPTAFDGGRALEGVPDGPIRVANVMGRRGRVRIAAHLVAAGATWQGAGDAVLAHAPWGDAALPDARLPAEATLRWERAAVAISPREHPVLVATVDRLAG